MRYDGRKNMLDFNEIDFIRSAPSDFREKALDNYSEISGIILRQIIGGHIAKEYMMPELTYFQEGLTFLIPYFNVMKDKGWRPEVVYLPRNIDRDSWSKLFKGRRMHSGNVHYYLNGNPIGKNWHSKVLDASSINTTARLWDVCIMSANDQPPLMGVSPDGIHGNGAKDAIKALTALPGADSPTSGSLLTQFSPTEEMYFALQLIRLTMAEKPVDILHTVGGAIGKEKVLLNDSREELAMVLYWDAGDDSIYSDMVHPSEYNGIGIRPTISAYSILQPQY